MKGPDEARINQPAEVEASDWLIGESNRAYVVRLNLLSHAYITALQGTSTQLVRSWLAASGLL